MALFTKSGLKTVPWLSSNEWHQVYKQVYSDDTSEQTKGYETLLIWKARMPKLPVGVECTLSLIQVCLRDKEWSSKIDSGELPMYYDNLLKLVYSTTIMTCLNHLSNIGNTKLTSMFQIAKQLKIPNWIVNLRHDAAHGHELPSVILSRRAAKTLLDWLHDEYWTPEGQAMKEQYTKISETEDTELCQILVDLIELWMAVGLYIEAGCSFTTDLKDETLKDTLKELRSYKENDVNDQDSYRLTTARSHLLEEISLFLSRNKALTAKKNIILNVMFENEAFLPTPELFELFSRNSQTDKDQADTHLPSSMIKFWQPLISVLHEKNFLESLTLKLLEFVSSPSENEHRRLCAALWINAICQGLIKLEIGQGHKDSRIMSKTFGSRVQGIIYSSSPELQYSLQFKSVTCVPLIFKNRNFILNVVLKTNEFTSKFIEPFLQLASSIVGEEKKDDLMQLVRIYTENDCSDLANSHNDTVHIHEDFMEFGEGGCNSEETTSITLADETIRSTKWKLAPASTQWGDCAFGVLPWQIDLLDTLKS